MNIKDILSDKTDSVIPVFKAEYYGGIYKKTEKIVCAVFLITDISKDKSIVEDIITDTKRVAKDTLISVIAFISHESTLGNNGNQAIEKLLTLRSMLHVLVASRAVHVELVDIISREIDGVIENIYTLSRGMHTGALSEVVEYQPGYLEPEKRQPKSAFVMRKHEGTKVGRVGTESNLSPSGSSDRRESILAIIRARKVVSIKDISDSITDCSEKTIQRELLDMIKDNIIVREGERRWSRYALSSR